MNDTMLNMFNERKDIVIAEKNNALTAITTKLYENGITKSNDFCLNKFTRKIVDDHEEVQGKLSDYFRLYSKITHRVIRKLEKVVNFFFFFLFFLR